MLAYWYVCLLSANLVCLQVCSWCEPRSIVSLQSAVDLDVVECLHAQDFLRATGFVPIRCAFDVHVSSASELPSEVQRWKQQLNDRAQSFFKVANGKAVFDIDGVDVTTSSRNAHASKSLASLVKLSPGTKQQSSESNSSTRSKKTAKKKNTGRAAAFDAWDDDGNAKSGVNGTSSSSSSGYLKSLEFGEIANLELLCSLSASEDGGEVSAPVLDIPGSKAALVSTPQPVHLHADTLVVVPLQSTLTEVLSLVRARLENQVRAFVPCARNAMHSRLPICAILANPTNLDLSCVAGSPGAHVSS